MVDWRSADRRRTTTAAARRRLDALSSHLAGAEDVAAPSAPAGEELAPPAKGRHGRHAATPVPTRRRVGAALEDRLPAGASALRGRGTVSGHHVAVLAVVLAAALAFATWTVLAQRTRPASVIVTDPAPAVAPRAVEPVETTPGAPPGSTPPSTPAGNNGTVIVDVAGKVRRPGIVTLPLGSRVVDALPAAGGARESVDLTSLNLARELVDGEQLLVGLAPPPAVPAPGGVPGPAGPVGPVNLNTATMAELDTLPGVGPVTAQAILDWRSANGSFSSVDELLEVDGIGEATLADLRDLVTV